MQVQELVTSTFSRMALDRRLAYGTLMISPQSSCLAASGSMTFGTAQSSIVDSPLGSTTRVVSCASCFVVYEPGCTYTRYTTINTSVEVLDRSSQLIHTNLGNDGRASVAVEHAHEAIVRAPRRYRAPREALGRSLAIISIRSRFITITIDYENATERERERAPSVHEDDASSTKNANTIERHGRPYHCSLKLLHRATMLESSRCDGIRSSLAYAKRARSLH